LHLTSIPVQLPTIALPFGYCWRMYKTSSGPQPGVWKPGNCPTRNFQKHGENANKLFG